MARTRARLVAPVRRLVQLLLVAFVVTYFGYRAGIDGPIEA
jgi:hypothetical protein